MTLVSLIFKFYNTMFFQIQGLTPDKEVRVSVKALAVSCVGAAAALHPEAFFNSLYLELLDGLPAEGRTSIQLNSLKKRNLFYGLNKY